MATRVYNQGFLELVNGTISWPSAGVYAVLVSSAYTYSIAHLTYSDISANIITDADYAPQDLTDKTTALVTNDVLYDSANISFGANVTIDASDGHLIFVEGSAATPAADDRLIFEWALPAGASSTNSEFTITTTNGIFRIQPSA